MKKNQILFGMKPFPQTFIDDQFKNEKRYHRRGSKDIDIVQEQRWVIMPAVNRPDFSGRSF
jgi:hypothetical protein